MAKKCVILQRPLQWRPHNLIFLRLAEICRQGPKEHFDTCRSFLHYGRIKVSKIHPWPLSYYVQPDANTVNVFLKRHNQAKIISKSVILFWHVM